MIDWQRFAEENNMNVAIFKHEIMVVASSIASMELDIEGSDEFKFTCSDQGGKLELTVKRVD